jgi:hypothetical protein
VPFVEEISGAASRVGGLDLFWKARTIMKLLSILTEFFINAFQITRPRADQQRRAELILGGSMLATIFLLVAFLLGLLIWALHI